MATASAHLAAPSLVRTHSSRPAARARSSSVRALARAEAEPAGKRLAQLGVALPLLLATPAAWAEDLAEGLSEGLGVTLPTPEAASQALVDATGSTDVQDLLTSSPWLIAGAVAIVAIPIALAGALGGGGGAQATSAANALEALKDDPRTVFLDIRSKENVREFGSPDLKGTRKTAVSIPFTQLVGEDTVPVEDFAEKVSKLRSIKEDSIVILFDSYGQDAPKAAKALAALVEKVYYVTGGGEGPNGWKATGQPWKAPGPAIAFDLKGLGTSIDNFAEDFKAAPNVTKLGIAAGAIGAASLVLFQEVEVLLEVLGVVVAGQFFAKNVLFAKDRKSTTKKLKVLVDEKIKPAEAGRDLKKLASTLLDTEQQAERAAVSSAQDKGRRVAETVQEKTKEAERFAQQWPSSDRSLASGVEKVRQEVKPLVKDASRKAEELKQDAKAAQKDLSQEAKSAQKDLSQGAKGVQKDLSSGAKEVRKEASNVADKAKSAQKDLSQEAKSAQEDLSQGAKGVQKDLTSGAKEVGKEASNVADKAKGEAKSAQKDLSQGAEGVQKDLSSGAKEVGKEASNVADKVESEAKSAQKDLSKEAKSAQKDLSSGAKEAKKEASSAADSASKELRSVGKGTKSNLNSGAQEAKKEASSAAESAEDGLRKVGEQTQKVTAGGAQGAQESLNGAAKQTTKEPSAASSDSSSPKAEAREWISAWRDRSSS